MNEEELIKTWERVANENEKPIVIFSKDMSVSVKVPDLLIAIYMKAVRDTKKLWGFGGISLPKTQELVNGRWQAAKEVPYYSNWIEKLLCKIGWHFYLPREDKGVCVRCNKVLKSKAEVTYYYNSTKWDCKACTPFSKCTKHTCGIEKFICDCEVCISRKSNS
jgi:hypothetical protein